MIFLTTGSHHSWIISSLQADRTLASDSSSSLEPSWDDVSLARFHEYPFTLSSSCDLDDDKILLNNGERRGEMGVAGSARGLNRFVNTFSNWRNGPRRIMSRRCSEVSTRGSFAKLPLSLPFSPYSLSMSIAEDDGRCCWVSISSSCSSGEVGGVNWLGKSCRLSTSSIMP